MCVFSYRSRCSADPIQTYRRLLERDDWGGGHRNVEQEETRVGKKSYPHGIAQVFKAAHKRHVVDPSVGVSAQHSKAS